MNVGFIGLGIMGRPMAEHLAAGGHAMFLYSRSGVPDGMTGTKCASPREVAEKAEVTITMVPDTPDVEKVLFGDPLYDRAVEVVLKNREQLPPPEKKN